MPRFSIAVLLCILSALTLTAAQPAAYVVPIVTAQVKDKWQGLYRFDSLTLGGGVDLQSADPIETTAQTISAPLTTSAIQTDSLRLTAGASLKHPVGGALTINVTNELRIDAGATIDVSSLGYDRTTGYPGTPALGSGNGGSHLGRGGTLSASGHTYGSVYRPAEAGRGGDTSNSRGGGVVRINAGSVVVDGSIVADGSSNGSFGNSGGSGGSVWITTGKITGTGAINANGGAACQAGGGGALSIEYTDATSTLPALSALSGQGAGASCFGVDGGPGTVRVAGPTSTFGDMTIDSGTIGVGTTELPSLGSGLALTGSSGATLVTDRAANVPAYFVGHWMRIIDAGGTVRGTWRIATINLKTVTLAPNGAETISVAVGDTWRGIYRFDKFTTRQVTLVSVDPIEYAIAGSLLGEASQQDEDASVPPDAGGTATSKDRDADVAALIALTLDPGAASGTASVQGVVTLSGEAPTGGALVLLSSSDPLHVIVPETIVVPAGAMSTVFAIETRPVDEVTEVTITATWGAGRRAVLQLIPVVPRSH
ncbi:MAG: hypothetical protein ABI779_19145 [Acidobacteriota bacterium]